jgi:hypothetical protein
MAGAWKRAGAVRRANETLRFSQAGREVARHWYERDFQSASNDALLALTAPVLRHVQDTTTTMQQTVRGSAIEPLLDPQFRRLTRPRGPVGKRQCRDVAAVPTSVITRVNSGALDPAPPPGLLENAATPSTLASIPGGLYPGMDSSIRQHAHYASFPALLLASMATLPSFETPPLQGQGSWKKLVEEVQSEKAPTDTALALATLAEMKGRPKFEPREYEFDKPVSAQLEPFFPSAGNWGTDPAEAILFREAVKELFTHIGSVPAQLASPAPVDLTAVRETILDAIDPRKSISAAVDARLFLDPRVARATKDPLDPILVAPEYEQPMYKPLAELGQDWLLPGLASVPSNAVLLLEPNRPFIEAYMVGLNHEMAREMLWQEFPTEQGATFFRQFWEPMGEIDTHGQPVAPEDLKDIHPLREWGSSSALGSHGPLVGSDILVLLVRGELLRRYPNTMVYAIHSDDPTSLSDASAEIREPLFRGTLSPDVVFLGFELTRQDLEPDADPTRRWYFVFQDQPGEARFGLDEPPSSGSTTPATRDDLTWEHVTVERGHITLESPPGGGGSGLSPQIPSRLTKNVNAEYAAWFTFQQPVRVAIAANKLVS